MNKTDKEITKASLKAEDKTLKELKAVYKKAREDVQQKISELNSRTDLQNIQSIIYQKKYQQAILDQINEALSDLNSGQYKTIEQYLTESYENGYIGTMYSLQSQGIPMAVPINDKNVVKALTTDSKLSSNYYKANPLKGRLEEDVDLLKTRIKTNLSRGIVAGKSWLDVAVDIASGMNNPFDVALKDAMRIVRTEGHRVYQQGHLDAGDEAKKKGADILKQWDATLDGNTRSAHQEADGQIVEWDEDFTVGGEKLKAPSIGGSAWNVVNCRCQLLQRARWALDEAELETLKQRAEFFGLDKADSFEEYKQKYLKLPEKADSVDLNKVVKLNPEMTADEVDRVGRHTLYRHWEEYRQKFLGNASEVDFDSLDSSFMYDTVKLGRYKDKEVVERIFTQVDGLSSRFYSPLQKMTWMDKTESTFSTAFATSNHGWGYGSAEMRFNPKKLTSDGIERLFELSQKGYSVKFQKGKEVEYLVTHEFGHCILNIGESLPSKSKNFVQCDFSVVKKARKEIDSIWESYSSTVKELEDTYKSYSDSVNLKLLLEGIEPTAEETKALMNMKSNLESHRISKYSLTDEDEFVAEAFTDAILGENPSEYSKQVYDVILKYFGKE
jgi:hypothetical protein